MAERPAKHIVTCSVCLWSKNIRSIEKVIWDPLMMKKYYICVKCARKGRI